MLEMSVTRIHKIEGEGATKAFCDIAIGDDLVINGLRVVEGKDGLFVAMPRECSKDGKWYNTVIPLNRATKDEIERIVLEAYDGGMGLNIPVQADGIWIPTKEISDGCGDTTTQDV